MKITLPLFTALLLIATSCATKGQILYVAQNTMPCEGVAPMNCLLAKKDIKGPWELFYDNIEGFTYEAGYRYKLKVEVSEAKIVPSDASSLKWKLISVEDKVADSSVVTLGP